MRCLSPLEAETIFGRDGFSIDLTNRWYRSALTLAATKARRQVRVAARQPPDIAVTSHFIRSLNRWLPSNRARLLWVDHWETGLFGGAENSIVSAAWRGLGEARTLHDAPGLYLDEQDWNEQDQTEIRPSQAEALGLLTGVAAIVMMTGSDGWLISAGSADRIEFWEGNFFFHSADATQIERANAIVDAFACDRWNP